MPSRPSRPPPPPGPGTCPAPGPGGRELPAAAQPHEAVRFAHNSERQLARLLDFYGIVWEYEPTEFILEWDQAGEPALAFRPDFYLPAYDLFIEITTLNQKLVTKKNRKVRRLRELHPEINIRVFYQRDYLNLLVKYGLEPPSQEVAAPADPEEAARDREALALLPLDPGFDLVS